MLGESLTSSINPSLNSERAMDLTIHGQLDAARVPVRHRRRDPSMLRHADWVAKRDQVVGLAGSGYLVGLIGNRGTGKTQLAVEAMVQAIGLKRPCLYAKAMSFFLDIKATFKSESRSESDVIAEYVTPRLLVIDELQVRGETEFEDRMLIHMVDCRYDAMVDTILIANLKPDEFSEAVGLSIHDRIREAGGLIKCGWPSFRGQTDE